MIELLTLLTSVAVKANSVDQEQTDPTEQSERVYTVCGRDF